MSEQNHANRIKQIRGEILVALKMLYPAAIQAEQLLRGLLAIFPHLEWDCLRKDLSYLADKGYLKRVVRQNETDSELTPWRKRYFRLTAAGVEIADRCVQDPAVEV
jgi:hypothetical protein